MSDDQPDAPMLSLGVPSTLGTWYSLCLAFFGPESKATAFIKEKMDKQGAAEPVLSDEGQLLLALVQIDRDART